MKGGRGGGVHSEKRQWQSLMAWIPWLVFVSLLVPLSLYNDYFYTGEYPYDEPSSTINDITDNSNAYEGWRSNPNGPFNETIDTPISGTHTENEGNPTGDVVQQPPMDTKDTNIDTNPSNEYRRGGIDEYGKGGVYENRNICEVRFGTYCLWREKNREAMNDSMVKKLKDQLFVARAYYPSIAKLPAQNNLSLELRQNIQVFEHFLSETYADTDLLPGIEKSLHRMEATIARAKSCLVDCSNVERKLSQILDMSLDEAKFHMKQSIFLYQLAVQTMPKSFHCLFMNHTVEYFKSHLKDMELSLAWKYSDPTLQHYVIFSKNILASSVTINSTVMHARDSGSLVFHVLTDEQNYFAMKLWFFRNTYKDAAVQVLDIEHLNMNVHVESSDLKLYLPREFRVSFSSFDDQLSRNIKTEYITMFSHSHHLLPEIFKSLQKIVVLNEDVVVQRDLSSLWNLDMGGKVNGAAQFCSLKLGLLESYMGENNIEEDSCFWMSGLNIIDLARWRELNLTDLYWKFFHKVEMGEKSVEEYDLAANLLTFHNMVYALDGWVLSGLGHDYEIIVRDIENAAVLHYNGGMKPWLNVGIPNYKPYWNRFLNREDEFLLACNINS